MSTLNEVLSGLHETDRKLKDKVVDVYSKVGLSAIQDGEQLLNSDNRINPAYNSLKVASIDQTGQDQIKQIKFTGNCKLTFGADGNAILRIGDNLNSSNFNRKDGTTDGTNITAGPTVAGVSGVPASDLNGVATQIYTDTGYSISTNEFIHFDDVTPGSINATVFQLKVLVGDDPQTLVKTYEFGPCTSGGFTTFVGKIPNSEDEQTPAITMDISSWTAEANTETGANGYQGKVIFNVPTSSMNELAQNADICFAIEAITPDAGTIQYGPTPAIFKVDQTNYSTYPTIGSVTFNVINDEHVKNSGIDYISNAEVTVNVNNITNINNPASVDIGNAVKIETTGGKWFATKPNVNENLVKSGSDAAATANYQNTFQLDENRIFYITWS